MINDLKGIRRGAWHAQCALLAVCVSVPAAGARQGANGDTAPKTPATAQTTTSSTKSKSAASPGVTKSASTSHTTGTAHHSVRRKKSTRVRGQKKIDGDRARTIQEALIRERYLSGEATGTWNQASEDAMRRYQADHGWQTKEVPDSRALISLGLGPSKDHLLNPDSAMTSVPQSPASSTPAPAQPSTPAPTTPPPSPSPSNTPGPQ